ncbi:MAG: response regulator [Lachnospiraceae bacterium]
MKKVLIVDDEYLQRELVKESVDWDRMDLCLVGEAEDGRQAVELTEKLKPDIIVMDINIPFMNGLEVAKKVKETRPDIQIIILTAYGEFEYAREAIRFGAVSFLLKPLDETEFERELINACIKIDESRKRFFLEGFAGFSSDADQEKWEEYGMKKEEKICLLYIRFQNEKELEEEICELRKIIEACVEKVEILHMQSDILFLISERGSKETFRTDVQKMCACIREKGKGKGFYGSVSGIYETPAELHLAYQEAYDGLLQGEKRGEFLHIGIEMIDPKMIPAGRKKVEEAKEFIRENYYRSNLTLNLIAEKLEANPSYLSSIFKKECGYSLSRYLISVRMEKAKQMMEESPDITVTEAAELVGYSDAYYFSKTFKQWYGILPSHYLEEQKNIRK